MLEAALRSLGEDGGTLDQIEERLFALRDAGRKHRVPVEALPGLLEETRDLLQRIDAGAGDLEAAERAAAEAHETFLASARRLSAGRATAAARLAKAVEVELPPLRLERAKVRVDLEALPEPQWGADGAERVAFEVCTNPGQPFGPIGKIASGGELSRFMLALKVVLARLDTAATLIFDEIDAGVGGATADAVGERLARLGGGAPGAGGDPRAADRRSRPSPLQRRQAGGRRADPCPRCASWPRTSAATRSPGCWPGPRSRTPPVRRPRA